MVADTTAALQTPLDKKKDQANLVLLCSESPREGL